MVFSALLQPSLLALTRSERLYALVLLSVNLTLLENTMSYGPGIMAEVLAIHECSSLHSAIWFKNKVVFYRYILVSLGCSSEVIAQQIVALLDLSILHFTCLNGIKTAVEERLLWPCSLPDAACICISGILGSFREYIHIIADDGVIRMLIHVCYGRNGYVLISESLLVSSNIHILVAMIIPLALSISSL